MLAVITTCYHEAGHAVAALRFGLPLRAVIVREGGSGLTAYQHWLGRAELEAWIVVTYAGGEAERDRFPGHPADAGDRRSIEAALNTCNCELSQERLDELRGDARQLVRDERRNIMRVANELLRCRSLSVAEFTASPVRHFQDANCRLNVCAGVLGRQQFRFLALKEHSEDAPLENFRARQRWRLGNRFPRANPSAIARSVVPGRVLLSQIITAISISYEAQHGPFLRSI